VKGDFNIVKHRQFLKKSNILKGSSDAQSSTLIGSQAGDISVVEGDMATGGSEDTGKQVEYGGLAGPVGSDQADQFTLMDLDAVICQGRDAAESFL
jgi:hypothetical protein